MYRQSFRKIKTLIPWQQQNQLIQPLINYAKDEFIYNNKKKIVDFTSGLMVVNLGHSNKYIQKGIKNYMNNGISYTTPSTFSNFERDKLSDRLCSITGTKYDKVFYTNGGADANEVALFIANNYTDKSKTISFSKSFHGGSSIASCLISGDIRREKKAQYYDLPLNPVIPNPDNSDNGKTSLETLENILKNDKDIGSIIIEGSSGSALCMPYPKNYLNKLEQICRRNRVLIICDEVMSGWGRTGELFAFQKEDFKPDIITTAKGLTSGYSPLGAVIIDNNISKIYEDSPISTGLTYFGHPLSCSIANKCLDLYLEDNKKLIVKANDKAKLIDNLSKQIVSDCEIVHEYRFNGLLGCLQLNREDPKLLSEINLKFLDEGIYCYMREDRIFIAPPLIIADKTISVTMEKIYNILIKFNK